MQSLQKVRILLAITIFFFIYESGFCRQEAFIRISVDNNVKLKDSLYFTVWDHYICIDCYFQSQTIAILPELDQPFEFAIKNPNYLMKIRLTSKQTGYLIPFTPIEPGDKIELRITSINGKETAVLFTGSGKAKMSFLFEFEKIKHRIKPIWSKLNKYDSVKDFDEDITFLSKEAITLLKKYENELTDTAYFILQTEVKSYFNKMKLLMTVNEYCRSNNVRKAIFSKYLKDNLENNLKSDPYDLLYLSKEYIEYIFLKSKVIMLLKYKHDFNLSDFNLNVPFSILEFYEEIKNTYNGKDREQLISYFLVNTHELKRIFGGIDPFIYKSLINDALGVLNFNTLKNLLEYERKTTSFGEKAFDFELKDINGNNIMLSNFLGKIILLDFWGNGCGACLEFKNKFDDLIYPIVKDITTFVFISINIDKDKDTWLKVVNKYSRPEFINLSLYAEGINHEVYKKYNVKSLPTVFLIDENGYIISSTLPRDLDLLLNIIITNLGRISNS